MESIHQTLNDRVLTQITQRLVEEFAPEQIFLFGSHAWGHPDLDSDLDLLVIVTNSDLSPPKRASRAYRILRDIPYPLDIMVKTRQEVNKFANVPAALEHQILQRGKQIYG
ncbi:MAG: DNA polymerase III subunit beta [Desulfobacterales bacterium CG23_combo_of_CG06-09_8_20_14_all_51_8]|nr:MAG: DNA polymerase III subunit beta [Desulfobacterales bacterium CG23_combo_of_CG06-09_8_20_14_all_51_8]